MNKTELALRFRICCFFLSSRKAGGMEGKADCSLASSPPPPPSSLDFFTASTDPSSFRQHWKHWNMQPNQTIVGPIAKQCLERLGQSPSLRSLETLVNAGIILGFNRSTTLTPSTHMYALWAHASTQAHTQTHTRHAQRQFGPGCSSLLPILLRSDATPAVEAHLLTESNTSTQSA